MTAPPPPERAVSALDDAVGSMAEFAHRLQMIAFRNGNRSGLLTARNICKARRLTAAVKVIERALEKAGAFEDPDDARKG